jgi:hypothetical protein
MIHNKNLSIHEAILSGAPVEAFDDPSLSDMLFGFENLNASTTEYLKQHADSQRLNTIALYKMLVLLAEAVGAKRVWNPQGGELFPDGAEPSAGDIEELLAVISLTVGFEIDFPNPFPSEFGLTTSQGIASERAIQAIYQAWRVNQLARRYGSKIVEIGAGLGRTAYYAYRMGLKDYTIIDLPFTNLSQANFLGRALSSDAISLFEERARSETIKIYPPTKLGLIRTANIVINVDSLTEMSERTSLEYAKQFAARSRNWLGWRTPKVLWSVNHEANLATVAELRHLNSLQLSRTPYWFRAGYVEELYASA